MPKKGRSRKHRASHSPAESDHPQTRGSKLRASNRSTKSRKSIKSTASSIPYAVYDDVSRTRGITEMENENGIENMELYEASLDSDDSNSEMDEDIEDKEISPELFYKLHVHRKDAAPPDFNSRTCMTPFQLSHKKNCKKDIKENDSMEQTRVKKVLNDSGSSEQPVCEPSLKENNSMEQTEQEKIINVSRIPERKVSKPLLEEDEENFCCACGVKRTIIRYVYFGNIPKDITKEYESRQGKVESNGKYLRTTQYPEGSQTSALQQIQGNNFQRPSNIHNRKSPSQYQSSLQIDSQAGGRRRCACFCRNWFFAKKLVIFATVLVGIVIAGLMIGLI